MKSGFCPRFIIIAQCMLLVFTPGIVHASDDQSPAARGTRFAESLAALHEQRIKTLSYTTSESIGGYGGIKADLAFYKEVKYFSRESGKLLANIKTEIRPPHLMHIMELYIYNDHGNLAREYIAAYLPGRREVPYQTLITIYDQSDGLQAFREFDASDDLLFEQCAGKYKGKVVRIAWDDLDMPDKAEEISDEFLREAYQACFKSLAKSAGDYLDPMNELRKPAP